MPKIQIHNGERNLVRNQLKELRKKHGYTQFDVACKLQDMGYDIDKSVLARIESNKRFVTDIELKAFADLFQVPYHELLEGPAGEDDNENEKAQGAKSPFDI